MFKHTGNKTEGTNRVGNTENCVHVFYIMSVLLLLFFLSLSLSSHSIKTITCNGRAQSGSTHCGVFTTLKHREEPSEDGVWMPMWRGKLGITYYLIYTQLKAGSKQRLQSDEETDTRIPKIQEYTDSYSPLTFK